MLQIANIFINVSKGEAAKAQDLQKAFNTTEIDVIVKEVCICVLLQCHVIDEYYRYCRKESCRLAKRNVNMIFIRCVRRLQR